MKLYTVKAITNTLASGLIKNFKITKVEKVGFNTMEGYVYHVNIKLETIDGYQNKLVQFEINSTYIDDGLMDTKEAIEEYISACFLSDYVLN